MKVKFETNRAKIRNLKAMDEALHILTDESKQGFFRSKGESEFKKFSPNSIVEDARFIELHVVKVYGKGEYKLNGNLSYNQNTKEVKFYILSVVDFDNFRYDDEKMAEFINTPNAGPAEDIQELSAIIRKIKKTKPAYHPDTGGGRHSHRRGSGPNGGGSKGGPKSTPNPKRQPLTEAQKAKRDKNNNKKNFRTDQRRNVSNNKKASF